MPFMCEREWDFEPFCIPRAIIDPETTVVCFPKWIHRVEIDADGAEMCSSS